MGPLKGGAENKKGFLQHAVCRQAKGLSLDSNFHLMAKVRSPVHSKKLFIP